MLSLVHEKNAQLLLQRAAWRICARIRELLASQERVQLAVPGGRSVVKVFETMREEQLDWSRVHIFMLDERLVPLEHPDSNWRLLSDHFVKPMVDSGRFPAENAHPFIYAPNTADRGARAYEQLLKGLGSRFDVILLSAGEDGHVGALFPDHHSVADPHHGFIVMDDSPKPPPQRMTSSLSLLMTAQAAILLFVGAGKRAAYRNFTDTSIAASGCPAKLVLTMKDAAVFTDLD